jgi:hypothetical protein
MERGARDALRRASTLCSSSTSTSPWSLTNIWTQAPVSPHDRPLVHTSVGLSISVSSTWVTCNRFAYRARRNGGPSTSATAHMDLAFSDEEHRLRRTSIDHHARSEHGALHSVRFAYSEPDPDGCTPVKPEPHRPRRPRWRHAPVGHTQVAQRHCRILTNVGYVLVLRNHRGPFGTQAARSAAASSLRGGRAAG